MDNTTNRPTDLALVNRLHGPDVTAYMATAYPDSLPLLADGWTIDAAIHHVEGTCDHAVCGGDHEAPALRVARYRGREVEVLSTLDDQAWVKFTDTGTQTWVPIRRLEDEDGDL